jgi:UDP-N-acetyl-D-mannosaminuronic acid transferase (WecB/TagA/CpsF family)
MEIMQGEIKIRKKKQEQNITRQIIRGGDAHLILKEVGLVRQETWIMPCHVRKRSGMTSGVELVRKYDAA